MEVENKFEYKWKLLPFVSISFIDNDTLISSGFDKLPLKLKRNSDDSW